VFQQIDLHFQGSENCRSAFRVKNHGRMWLERDYCAHALHGASRIHGHAYDALVPHMHAVERAYGHCARRAVRKDRHLI